MTRIRVLKTEIDIIERKLRRLMLRPDAETLTLQLERKRARRLTELNDRHAALLKFRNERCAHRMKQARDRATLNRQRRRGTLAPVQSVMAR